MRRLGRGSALPAPVRAAVPGRPLAAAASREGAWLVGTRSALHVVGEEPFTIPWERVHRADWAKETSTLRIWEVAEYGATVRARSFVLPEPGGLIPLLRERVTASIVVQRRFEVRGKRGFVVIARRSPEGGGPIGWAYEFDAGVDPAVPDVMATAEAALREVQGSLGEQ